MAHRRLVAAFLQDSAAAPIPWLNRAQPLLLARAVDGDASVRELGLGALESEHSPYLLEAAEAQLGDADPLLRLLGSDYVRRANPKEAVPILVRLLDDPDLRVVVAAESGLARLSGQDFGVRTFQAIPSHENSGELDPANAKAIREGVARRKEWWHDYEHEYPPPPAWPEIHNALVDAPRPPAPDFSLQDLQGRSVRLSSLRGKPVFVNFWASWCTACLAEIPDLVALQKEMGAEVVILGVALDGVPDEEGEISGDDEGKPSKSRPTLDSLRAKVGRAVQARGINYPIVLDPENQVGSQYNGGELPTTVLFDADGRVCRRFIGERSLVVFKAMMAQAMGPLRSGPRSIR